jgi:hypothetical protein
MRTQNHLTELLFNILIFVFLLVMAHLGHQLFKAAADADRVMNKKVSTDGDAHGYQKTAVNILHGFGPADSESLPLEEYKLDLSTPWGLEALKYEKEHGPREVISRFDRPPGFPFMMAVVYAVTGVETIYARYLLAACVFFGSLFLAIGGYFAGNKIGAIAGMITALFYISTAQPSWFEGILTEIPASFWVACFFMFFACYERLSKYRSVLMLFSAISLEMFIFTRFNFFTTVPFIFLYLLYRRAPIRHICIFLAVTILPLVIWSAVATKSLGKLTIISTQGSGLFATSNNSDSLYGVGSDGWNRGGWNPGWVKSETGSLSCDYKHLPSDGSGWSYGLNFWKNNITKLPLLFYWKMEKGLWFNEGTVSGFLKTEGFLILAVCFLLFAIGHNTKESQSKLDENSNRINLITFTQIVLLTISIASWNQVPFYWIGIIWVGLLLLSIVNNIRKSSCLNFDYPVWVGAFALSHLASTLIFYGSWRFHQPFDLLMLFLAFYGLLKVLQTIWSNYRVFGVLTGLVWLCLIASRFDLI